MLPEQPRPAHPSASGRSFLVYPVLAFTAVVITHHSITPRALQLDPVVGSLCINFNWAREGTVI